MTIIYIIIALVILTAIWAITSYNHMINMRNRTQEAWSDIDVQYKRRHDLIPNLVETVKGYQKHESAVFLEVTNLRSTAMETQSIAAKDQAEANLALGLGKIFAVAENYPELKASTNFIELQNSLSNIEEQIQNARRYYNGVARDYNSLIQSFPNNFLANIFKFSTVDFLKLETPEEKQVPKVTF